MKTFQLTLLLALGLWATQLQADDAALLSGKWLVKKVNDQGETYRQTIQVKKDKFVFEILGADDHLVLHAEGDLKLEKLGPFSSVRFIHIRAGNSLSTLDDVDDEYACVYKLDGDTWNLASNFDKDRENQKPVVDVYQRVKTAPAHDGAGK
ncbi:MAG TPA: hypothetical protein VG146_20100 [Verrucomicrobiae bacterium]|nr:hypothetical protein [Verrucomicrobiae bacterium]